MKRKAFVIMVCLALLLFSFPAAMADDTETITTITAKPGPVLADNSLLNQVCDTAAIRIHTMPEGYGALVLSLGDVDALTNLFRIKEEGFYLQSDLLGPDPLYFDWEDLMNLLMEEMESNPEMAPLKDMMAGDTYNTMVGKSMHDGEMPAQMAEMMGMDAAMMDFISSIENSETIETGTFALSGSDIADQKAVTVVTKDDMMKAIDLPMVREQLTQQVSMASYDMSQDEIDAEVDQAIAEIKTMVDDSNLTVTVTEYTADAAFIAAEVVISGDLEIEEGKKENGSITVTITKNTIDQAEFYQMKTMLRLGEEEFLNQKGSLYLEDAFITGNYNVYSLANEPLITATFNWDMADPAKTMGEFAITMYDEYDQTENAALVTFSQTKTETTADATFTLYAGGSIETIKSALTDANVITLHINTVQQPDSGFFADLQNAAPDTAVQLMQMNDDELNDYMSAVEQNFAFVLLNMIDNLPPDVSDLLLQGMGAY